MVESEELGQVSAPTRYKSKTKRYYLIRGKICNTGIAMLLICCFLAILCVFKPEYIPVFVLSLIIMILTIIQAFYVKEIEVLGNE
ncbi:hypothetical protein J7K27_10145 [Candidatus Bathyarchaeota archaeon]|nr:hypothetical protein [Candidatus Bathyarchaeota archaeon]